MACLGCSCSTGKDGVSGCKSNGGCGSGGCNRHNTYDWITALGIREPDMFDIVEVSFKNGSRKEFFKNPAFTRASTGDDVLVESYSGGYDVGRVSLSGELVRLQMKRKRVREDARMQTVIRKAHDRDMERLDEVRKQERDVMIKARAIARTLDLDMKVGDVEFQGDGRKCTFYYTADGRVDFRELIRHYARDFRVKIEMRQIGARQESARIGGLGNCGRELCCSTWLTEFKSVNTAAARYQNLAINQVKLSGMCGRLKCCLNYELDTYIDALEDFPDRAERLKTRAGNAVLVKTDVFKRLMYYTYLEDRGKFYPIHVDQVWEALDMLKKGDIPASLDAILEMAPPPLVSDEPEEEEPDFENVENVLELPLEKRKKKKRKKKKERDRSQSAAAAVERADQAEKGGSKGQPPSRGQVGKPQRGPNRPDNRNGANTDNRPPRPDNPGGKGGEPRPPRPDNREGNKNEPRPPRPDNREGNKNEPRPPRPDNRGGNEGEPRPPRPDNREGNKNEPRPPRPDNREGNKNEPRPPRPDNREGNGGEPRPPRPDNREGNGGEPRPPRPDNREGNKNEPRPPRPDNRGGNEGGKGGEPRPPRPDNRKKEGENKNEPRPDQPKKDD